MGDWPASSDASSRRKWVKHPHRSDRSMIFRRTPSAPRPSPPHTDLYQVVGNVYAMFVVLLDLTSLILLCRHGLGAPDSRVLLLVVPLPGNL